MRISYNVEPKRGEIICLFAKLRLAFWSF